MKQQLNKCDESIINEKIKALKNLSSLVELYFKPFDQFVENGKYNTNDAIKAKESLHKYLQKYAAFTINTSVQGIQNIVNNE